MKLLIFITVFALLLLSAPQSRAIEIYKPNKNTPANLAERIKLAVSFHNTVLAPKLNEKRMEKVYTDAEWAQIVALSNSVVYLIEVAAYQTFLCQQTSVGDYCEKAGNYMNDIDEYQAKLKEFSEKEKTIQINNNSSK